MKTFLRDERGSIAVLAALTMTVTLGCAAIAVDVGSFYLERRSLQAASDLAAIAAARDIGHADDMARRVFQLNGFHDASFVVETGSYRGEKEIPLQERFAREDRSPNAVRVTASSVATPYFSKMFMDEAPTVSVVSVASLDRHASVAIGSRLASLEGGIVNDFLRQTIGADIRLTAMDHRGLVGARLDLGILAHTAVALTGEASTLGQLLDRRVDLAVFVETLSVSLRESGQPVAAASLHQLKFQLARARATVRLGDVLGANGLESISIHHLSSLAGASLSVEGLLSAALLKSGRSDSVKLDVGLPGLARIGVEALVGEGMQGLPSIALGREGAVVKTAQTRMRLEVGVGGQGLLSGIGVHLPLEVVLAGGSATVAQVSCHPDPRQNEVVLMVTPGLAKVEIAEFEGPLSKAGLEPYQRPASLARLLLVEVQAKALARIQDQTPQRVVFRGAEIGNGTMKTVRSRDFVRSIVPNLVRDLKLTPVVLGISLVPVGNLLSAVLSQLQPLAAPLDLLLGSVLDLVGVRVGEVDVRVDGISCGRSSIVS